MAAEKSATVTTPAAVVVAPATVIAVARHTVHFTVGGVSAVAAPGDLVEVSAGEVDSLVARGVISLTLPE